MRFGLFHLPKNADFPPEVLSEDEDKEHTLFGKEGFERIVTEVPELERKPGPDGPAGFTAI